MHESLVLALYFPMFRYQPWICKGTKYLDSFRSSIKAEFNNGKAANMHSRLIYRKLISLNRSSADRIKSLLSSDFKID